ncbi:MAG: aminotransferase class IV [Fuerstiella sp.]
MLQQDLAVPFFDLGVVAGAAVSEMARTYRHKLFQPEVHVSRLLESCEEIGFGCSYSKAELIDAAQQLVAHNSRSITNAEDLGVVWFVTAGANPTYLGQATDNKGTVGLHTFRLPFELWAEAAASGVRLRVPSVRQLSTASLPIHRKVRNRLHWWLADREAATMEPGARALLLDNEGHVTETSTSAFYIVRDAAILTPATNVLDSLSGRLVEQAAGDVGLEFRRTSLTMDEVHACDAAFVSSTPSGLFEVASVDGEQIPSADIVARLLQWWEQKTGINPRQQILSVAAVHIGNSGGRDES